MSYTVITLCAWLFSTYNYYYTDKFGKRLFYTSDVVHRDKDGDYQIYGRVDDAIRYNGELLNLPVIEGAAVSS